jgi:hypothetical protein
MSAAGAISDRVRDIIPYTWTALLGETARYGPEALQRRIDLVKSQLFGTGAGYKIEDDEDQYPPAVAEYLAKLATLQIIPAGIELWMNKHTSVSTPGHAGAESANYPDRVQALKDLRDRLLIDAQNEGEALKDILDDLGRTPLRTGLPSPIVNTSHLDEVAPDPQTFGSPYAPYARDIDRSRPLARYGR